MATVNYEKHQNVNPNFPITFHFDWNTQNRLYGFGLHWHEHIEILYFTNGCATAVINNNSISATKGDIVVISSNALHAMPTKPMDCTYHCLIISKLFFDNFFVNANEFLFDILIQDERAIELFNLITEEMTRKNAFYKEQVKAYTAQLLVLLVREFSIENSNELTNGSGQKLALVKKIIGYISLHYKEPLTIDEIAKHSGFNKYYLCHAFKDITGQTIVDYINGLRCNNAKKKLMSGLYNISESAAESGFNNLSYFTKTYKKHMGVLPSQDILPLSST